MTIAVGDILRIVCILVNLDGSLVENVWNLVVSGAGGPFDEDDIVDDMADYMDEIYGNLTTHIEPDLDPSEVVVYVYDSIDDDWDEIGSSIPTFLTTGGTEPLPRGVAALINAKTSDPDVNGKKYMGGLVEGIHSGAGWGATFLTALAALALDWYTPATGAASGADFTAGIWSPTRTSFFPLSGTFIVPVIAAYQRRRKPGVGV